MNGSLFPALLAAAVSLGILHSLAPDHWAPFAAVARARGWGARRIARVTLLCGFGHVTGSVVLGLLGLFLGLELFQRVGSRMEAIAGWLLILFGVLYGVWGLRRVAGEKIHGHSHRHYDHVHDASKTTAGSLFVLACVDPCVAVIPILFASAPLGWTRTLAVIVTYELATLGTMVGLVLAAHAGASRLRFHFLDHYGDAAAGAFIATVGIVVSVLRS